MNKIYIGRQPIYNQNLDVCAYELLYRPNNLRNEAGELDHNHATAQVLLNAFVGFGLDQLVGDKPAFVNLPRDFIVGNLPLPFPKERVVLEILEDVVVDAPLTRGVERLRDQGYDIALDDFIYHETLQPLVKASKIVKIDFQALERDQIRTHVTALRRHPVALLAEKVETYQDFDFAREQGFDYFQGYFFCRPKVLTSHSIPANRLSLLQLMSLVQRPDVEVAILSEAIGQDVALSYKLIRGLNSALYALPKPIESIRHAIVYLGLVQVKRWITLIALTSLSDKPTQLMVVGITRAKMCERLGEMLGEIKDVCFTVGLFSVLDALMDTTMGTALSQLPLSDGIKAALLERAGGMGRILQAVMAYEAGAWDDILLPAVRPDDLTQAYLDGVAWADEVMGKLQQGAGMGA